MSAVRDMFENDPPSEWLAKQLKGKDRCMHGRNPCYLRCGVRGQQKRHVAEGIWVWEWEVIPKEERLRWLEGVEADHK